MTNMQVRMTLQQSEWHGCGLQCSLPYLKMNQLIHLHCKYLGTEAVCGYSFIRSFQLDFLRASLSEQDDACIMQT